jgi:hypothetical protein
MGGLTRKEEQFARLVALPDERGKWRTMVDSYLATYESKRTRRGARNDAYRVSHRPRVAARIEELRREYRAEVDLRLACGIAAKENRILRKQERHDLLMDVIAKRAAAEKGLVERIRRLEVYLVTCEEGPRRDRLLAELKESYPLFLIGEDTGLLTRDYKSIAGVEKLVGRLDKALLDAVNDLENDVARELGDLTIKVQQCVELTVASDEGLDAFETAVKASNA